MSLRGSSIMKVFKLPCTTSCYYCIVPVGSYVPFLSCKYSAVPLIQITIITSAFQVQFLCSLVCTWNNDWLAGGSNSITYAYQSIAKNRIYHGCMTIESKIIITHVSIWFPKIWHKFVPEWTFFVHMDVKGYDIIPKIKPVSTNILYVHI